LGETTAPPKGDTLLKGKESGRSRLSSSGEQETRSKRKERHQFHAPLSKKEKWQLARGKTDIDIILEMDSNWKGWALGRKGAVGGVREASGRGKAQLRIDLITSVGWDWATNIDSIHPTFKKTGHRRGGQQKGGDRAREVSFTARSKRLA